MCDTHADSRSRSTSMLLADPRDTRGRHRGHLGRRAYQPPTRPPPRTARPVPSRRQGRGRYRPSSALFPSRPARRARHVRRPRERILKPSSRLVPAPWAARLADRARGSREGRARAAAQPGFEHGLEGSRAKRRGRRDDQRDEPERGHGSRRTRDPLAMPQLARSRLVDRHDGGVSVVTLWSRARRPARSQHLVPCSRAQRLFTQPRRGRTP